MLEGFCITVISFSFLVLFASGTDILYGNFTGLERIFMPYFEETGKLALMPTVCNVTFSMVEVIILLKRCDQHISMRCYELKYRNRAQLFWSQKKDLYRFWIILCAGYLTVDIFAGIILGQMDWLRITYMMASFLLTTLLWTDSVYLLRTIGCGSRETLFVVFLLILISLLLLPHLMEMSVFAYGAMNWCWSNLFMKLLAEVAFLLTGFWTTKKRDLL